MTTGKRQLAILLVLFGLIGCGGDQTGTTPTEPVNDSILMQEALTETITRWRYGDKASLFDNELEYVQEKWPFDIYLTFRQIEFGEADTVKALNIIKIQQFQRDSAWCDIEVVFQGPSGKISKDYDKYTMYFHRGRWIRPTIGTMETQVEYEKIRRAADSAAEEEAREGS